VLRLMDPGACPGPDPGFAGMTQNANFGLFTSPSMFNVRHSIYQIEFITYIRLLTSIKA
jgi:hypothetical protein